MKHLFTVSLALAAGLTIAQAQAPAQRIKQLHQQTVQMLLNRQSNNAAQKTTGLQQRLIAQQHERYNTSPAGAYDSAHYYYNNTAQGSVYDLTAMLYDGVSPDDPLYVPLLVKADSSSFWIGNDSIPLLRKSTRIMTYDMAGNITLFTGHLDYPGAPNVQPHIAYTYNAQGWPVVIASQRVAATPSGWEDVFRRCFTYNAQGRVLLDSASLYNDTTGLWLPVARTTYTYDASGLDPLTVYHEQALAMGAPLTPMGTTTNSFYPDHRLIKSILVAAINNTTSMDSFGYTGNSNFFTYHVGGSYNASQAVFTPYSLDIRHVNAQGLPDTSWHSTANPNLQMELRSTDIAVYNTNGLPERFETYSVNAGNVTPYDTYFYYYETYNSTSVATTPTPAQDIQLYPNPAGSQLNICWNNAVAGTPVTINIVNINGQTVYSQSQRWTGTTQQLPVGRLAPGMYGISIAGQDGRTLYNGKFVKQ